MAEGGEGGNWWGGWIQAAKEKSSEAWSFMQRDLKEFTTVVQKDTSAAVAHTADTVKGKLKVEDSSASSVKAGFSNFLMGLSETLAPKNYGRENEEVDIPHKVIFDRAKARLNDIQTDPGTYLNEPNGSPEDYLNWKETFLVDENKGQISDLLVASDEVRSLYTKLVPSAVSHGDFWHRYFYKIHQLEQDEARRNALKERAEITSKTFTEEDLGWGDEDETWEVADAPTDMSDDPTIERTKCLTSATDNTESGIGTENKDSENITDDLSKLSVKEDTTDTAEGVDSKTEESSICEVTESSVSMTPGKTQEEHKELENVEAGEDSKTTEEVDQILECGSQGDSNKGKDEERKDLHLPLQKEEFKKESSGKSSPVQSDNGTSTKDTSSLSDDWEKDFDIEITEHDLKIAASVIEEPDNDAELDDDWENWE